MYNTIYHKLNKDLDIELMDELEKMFDSSLYYKIAEYLENDVYDFTQDLSNEINIYL